MTGNGLHRVDRDQNAIANGVVGDTLIGGIEELIKGVVAAVGGLDG